MRDSLVNNGIQIIKLFYYNFLIMSSENPIKSKINVHSEEL